MLRVYIMPNCKRCEELKIFLKNKNIVCEELNVEKNPKALAKMVSNGIEQYPVVEINGRLYDREVNDLKKLILAIQ